MSTNKRKAVLFFCTGEFYWEFGRFAPHFIWKRKKQYTDDVDFIVMTSPENFDIYGKYATILVPFSLKNEKFIPNCFRLDNMTQEEYSKIITIFQDQFRDRYYIQETIYPNISKKEYVNKNQFPIDKMRYEYKPREENSIIVKKYLNEKPVIILGPRYRKGFSRNWNYWNELYDLIYDNKELIGKYNFVICGKEPDYVPDLKNRFIDINLMDKTINSSLSGLAIECIKKAFLTVGSQSAVPNISLLLGVPVLEWGHQKHLHTVVYNPKNIKVNFIEDMNYTISPKIIYDEMLKLL